MRGQELGVRGELVARVTVKHLLVGQRLARVEAGAHPPEPDPDAVGEVAPLLGAARVRRLEPVGRAGVAGEALDVLERRGVGFEVGAVSGGGRDPPPRVLRRPGHMALLADLAGYLAMWRDRFRPGG